MQDYFEREQGRMLASAPGNNDYHGLQSAFGADEPDHHFTEFLKAVTVDGDQDETTHAKIFNSSTRPQSIRRVYFENGDQDETTHANIFNDSTRPQSIRRVYFEDGDQDETTHANIFNDSTRSQSIRGVYFEDDALSSDDAYCEDDALSSDEVYFGDDALSSDTDAEVLLAQVKKKKTPSP